MITIFGIIFCHWNAIIERFGTIFMVPPLLHIIHYFLRHCYAPHSIHVYFYSYRASNEVKWSSGAFDAGNNLLVYAGSEVVSTSFSRLVSTEKRRFYFGVIWHDYFFCNHFWTSRHRKLIAIIPKIERRFFTISPRFKVSWILLDHFYKNVCMCARYWVLRTRYVRSQKLWSRNRDRIFA